MHDLGDYIMTVLMEHLMKNPILFERIDISYVEYSVVFDIPTEKILSFSRNL